MNLIQFRKKIDEVDKKLIKILSERKKLSAKVGLIKKSMGLKTRDLKREQEIRENKKRLAEKYKLRLEFIDEIFALILRESRRIIDEKKGTTSTKF